VGAHGVGVVPGGHPTPPFRSAGELAGAVQIRRRRDRTFTLVRDADADRNLHVVEPNGHASGSHPLSCDDPDPATWTVEIRVEGERVGAVSGAGVGRTVAFSVP
jgi:hypothetical protein